MKPFEVLGTDGRVYLHHDNWNRWKHETLSVHPGEGKWRFDLDLRNPRDTLEEVPVRNRNVHAAYTPHTCFYECDDWSTIYDFYESNEPMFRMIVESQNPEPIWGERITLLSSSTYFKPEPWGRNTPNQFAYFRGKYWQVVHSELLYHEFPAGVGYPLRDNGEFGVPRRGNQTTQFRLTTAEDLIRVFGTDALIARPEWLNPNFHWSHPSKFNRDDWTVDWKKEGF